MTVTNAYKGTSVIEIGGKSCTLVYDWEALGALWSHFHDLDIHAVLKAGSPKDLAVILSEGLKRHQPEMTVEEIMRISPPLVRMVQAVSKALNLAYWGKESGSSDQPADDGEAEDTADPQQVEGKQTQ
jgi:hypothetical protein